MGRPVVARELVSGGRKNIINFVVWCFIQVIPRIANDRVARVEVSEREKKILTTNNQLKILI